MIYDGNYIQGIKTRDIFGDVVVVRFKDNTPIKNYYKIDEQNTQEMYEKLWIL